MLLLIWLDLHLPFCLFFFFFGYVTQDYFIPVFLLYFEFIIVMVWGRSLASRQLAGYASTFLKNCPFLLNHNTSFSMYIAPIYSFLYLRNFCYVLIMYLSPFVSISAVSFFNNIMVNFNICYNKSLLIFLPFQNSYSQILFV